MEREANPPPRPLLSSSSADFVRNIHAVFKRPRPLGVMPSNLPRARRILASQKGPPGKTATGERKSVAAVVAAAATAEESSVTIPSVSGTLTFEEGRAVALGHRKGYDGDGDGFAVSKAVMDGYGGPKRVQVLTGGDAGGRVFTSRVGDERADYIMYVIKDWTSIMLTEGQSSSNNHARPAAMNYEDLKQQDLEHIRSCGLNDQLLDRTEPHHNDHFMNVHHMTQSLASIASCATTMSVNSTSAPRLTSTTYSPRSCRESGLHTEIEESDLDPQPVTRVNRMPNSLASQTSVLTTQALEGKGSLSKENDGVVELPKDNHLDERSNKRESILSDVRDPALLTKNSLSNVNSKPPPPSIMEKAHHKKHSDSDAFYKVNGKLYQKLGKIGSGGSSEVHKVIASDCTIYALKKIKLKGRDYPTAYGFCQEILYLNKLKGKNSIIQLIDYEVTDRALLEDVMNGSTKNMDGRIKNDAYIYMVLEYGEVDLAHMVAQKWKETDCSNLNIDENWLRFYWQQMLLAVNTIHEERIVHSDLKPANFLLVKGSLKLIDFGIAKAIMSDTTNIQRDSQVGTLNYMSPEAFMWNEHDASVNTIKCGRPSDIWSLGCILYQMVYCKTPFSDYKTFWAKFKVITDRNHKISYDPLPNMWLIDLMKKCLAWDRNERWKIPQLLQHSFLAPPMPKELPPWDD